MEFWKELEKWYNDKGEIKLHADLKLEEGELLRIIAEDGNGTCQKYLDHIEKVPQGQHYKVHLEVSLQPYKDGKRLES
ncbi:hypothetical protein CL621_01825 [archaeon]|nr:hypothetical protein [archaeon]|tara:strand:+ start:637 stop:870 length:234 start_codon:yes stop_codon:yes gene_type:complete